MGNDEILKDGLADIALDTCDALVQLADRCHISRDYVAGYFAEIFSKLIMVGTLEEREVKAHG